ncbi:MAG: tRNA pseudouridine(38-40) synthase TruA [Bacteroidales bacterium]|jgi:tRNA pseudouridine38-40 synthase|nr:tRNA pseudouridine(38-40) synthase TruA [Bacteroidales bacterium]
MRYCIHLAYNGRRFFGWQIQPHQVSVQECITQALEKIVPLAGAIVGVGRTDTGVHAHSFFAHFDTEKEIDTLQITQKLNRMLPFDIVVFSLTEVAPDFHARFSAKMRKYRYTITQTKNPFLQETAYFFPFALNVKHMNEACTLLIGTHDFTSFSKLHTDVSNNICTVFTAEWLYNGDVLEFYISANRFLRNMVRAITGTLLDVGQGKISVAQFQHIIDAKNRQCAGQSIPACGLSLIEIEY